MGSPLDTRPSVVALVALGPSHRDFVSALIPKKPQVTFDEVWVVNSGTQVFKADKYWLMDDMRTMANRYPAWMKTLETMATPIVTCRAYPEYPSAVEYPLDAVVNCIKDDFFTSTVAYAIGYAILTGVKDLYIFGCDFSYPGSLANEPGAESVSYMLGIARERGVNFKLPMSSTLLDCHLVQHTPDGRQQRPLYGYDYNPGDCKAKVQAGTATELEKMLALKSPFNREDKSHAHDADPHVPNRSPHWAGGARAGRPVREIGAAGGDLDLPAARPSLLGRRKSGGGTAPVGDRAPAANVGPGAETGGVDAGAGRQLALVADSAAAGGPEEGPRGPTTAAA